MSTEILNPPSNVLDELSRFVEKHGVSPAVVTLEDYFSVRDYAAIHGAAENNPEILGAHRRMVHRDLMLLSSHGTHAAIYPIAASDFHSFIEGKEGSTPDLIQHFINVRSRSDERGVMHQGPYPFPQYAIARYPEEHTAIITGGADHLDEYFILSLRDPFHLVHIAPSRVAMELGQGLTIATPWPAYPDINQPIPSDSLITDAVKAYRLLADAADDPIRIERDVSFKPPQYLLFENFATDQPVRLLLDTKARCLVLCRLDSGSVALVDQPNIGFVQVTWMDGVPHSKEQRVAVIQGMLSYLGRSQEVAA